MLFYCSPNSSFSYEFESAFSACFMARLGRALIVSIYIYIYILVSICVRTQELQLQANYTDCIFPENSLEQSNP